jgi:hypothetical protein
MPDSKVVVQASPVVGREVLDVPTVSSYRVIGNIHISPYSSPDVSCQKIRHHTTPRKQPRTPDSPSTPILRIKPLPKSLQPLIRPPHILPGLFLF